LTGGGHEHKKRSGTENLAGIVAMAAAIDLVKHELPDSGHKMRELRDYFESGLAEFAPIRINGEGERVCNTSNIAFEGVDGETLLMHLDRAGIAASHGSACSSGALEPSRVLLNMGLSQERARSSVRFSLSRDTTREEIEATLSSLKQIFLLSRSK
jgi:cysteine desulfurase